MAASIREAPQHKPTQKLQSSNKVLLFRNPKRAPGSDKLPLELELLLVLLSLSKTVAWLCCHKLIGKVRQIKNPFFACQAGNQFESIAFWGECRAKANFEAKF